MLGVVVVLDDQPAVAGPVAQFAPSLAVENYAGRELVRGRQHRDIGPTRP